MTTFSLPPSLRTKFAAFTAALLVLTNIQVGALQFVLPMIGTTHAAQESILPQDLTNQVLADLPSSMPSSITIGTDQSPFTVRSEVNVTFARYNLPTIPTDFNISGALRNESSTLRATCNLFGYATVASSKTIWLGDGRSNFSSCGDNKHAIWNGSTMEIVSACGGQWTSQLVCSDPLLPPVPECEDNIDNDGDGATDDDDYGCQVGTKESEPLAQCQDGIDNDDDGGVDSPNAIVTGGTPALGGTSYTVADREPFNVRSFVNRYVSTPISDITAIHNDNDTALHICRLAGYNHVASVGCQSAYGNGCGYTSPHNNKMAKWDGTTFQILPASGNNQWIATLVCDQPIQVLPCQDGIDNDNDGRTDMQDPDCTSPRHTSEKPADLSCSSPQDNDESPADRPNLRIAKTPEFSTIVRGQQLRYQIDILNAGTATAHSVEVRDRVSSNLTFVASSPANGCAQEGLDVVCGIPSLPPGQQQSFILTFSTTPATSTCSPTTITNTASVVSAERDGNASDNTVTAETVSLTCPLAQCQDGLDNDGDGKIDFPQDPGCTSATDNDEYNAPTPQCSDGLDNDGDGATDYPSDFSCSSPTDNDETNPKAACQDGYDNDGDGKTDYPLDPGCSSLQDNDEYNASNITLTSVTANGCTTTVAYSKNFDACAHLLVTSNGQITHSQNVFCNRNGPVSIQTSIFNSLFQIGTSVKLCNGNDYNDCSAPVTITGTTQCLAQCSDGIDNDNDGATDYPSDFSCSSPTDNDETNPKAACQDGYDNDGDGKIDFPQDPGCSSLQDNDEYNVPTPQCSDGLDNDGDGATDYPSDFSCSSPTDNDETNPKAACQDGYDNDGDGKIDFPQDPGCSSLQDNDEYNVPTPQCSDGLDNDGDGKIDFPQDPGCTSATDNDEYNAPTPQCSDGLDNDGDGATDYPSDFSCSSPTDNDETNPKAACQDGYDNDGDGKTDYPLDPGCSSLQDNDEYNVPTPACRDGLDNDNDGRTDYPNDPGCSTPDDTNEGDEVACNDRRDNDFDGLIDFPQDPGCASPTDTDEFNAPVTQCSDGIDNDNDGRIDMFDPGCSSPQDNNEGDEPACNDRRDNDGDNLIDWPLDPGCTSPIDTDEYNAPVTQCSDGIDNDGDWRVDMLDPGCSSPQDNNEGDDPACSDRIDNDNDGRIDFPLDPGCASLTDTDETDPYVAQCSDGRDNDFDGKVDMLDPGCSSPEDNNESDDPTLYGCIELHNETFDPHGTRLPVTAQFTFVLDATRVAYNDSTGYARFDNVLAGQHNIAEIIPSGWTQYSVTPAGGNLTVSAGTACAQITFRNRQVFVANAQCSDGYDNDGDGLKDYPSDPGCQSATDNDEYNNTFVPQCRDNIDNDGDGLKDYPQDPGCFNADDNNEQNQATNYACSDGADNDNDGLIDFPSDPGCLSATDTDETNNAATYACSDGLDNDNDGKTDYPQDPGCSSAQDTDEFNFRLARCSDGVDNDGDGLKDYPQDPGCTTPYDDNEYNDRYWIDRWKEWWNWNW